VESVHLRRRAAARRYAELVDATQGNRTARVDEYLAVRRIHRLFALLRLRYVIGAPQHVIPGATEVYADEQYKVFELSGALPRAFVPATWEVVPDSETALNRLTSPDFDPSAKAIVTAGIIAGASPNRGHGRHRYICGTRLQPTDDPLYGW